jgi:hypothetical protein
MPAHLASACAKSEGVNGLVGATRPTDERPTATIFGQPARNQNCALAPMVMPCAKKPDCLMSADDGT